MVFSLLDSPTTTRPLVGLRGCTFIYLWNVIRPGPRLFMATYVYVANQSKCVSGKLFLKSCNARSCKVMQHYARSCNVLQGHAKSLHHARQVTHQLGQLYSPVVMFRLSPGWSTLLSYSVAFFSSPKVCMLPVDLLYYHDQ